MLYLPYDRAHIYCLVIVNDQQVSMNVNSSFFPVVEEFIDTPLLSYQTPLCCFATICKKTKNKLFAEKFYVCCYTTNIYLWWYGTRNKIGGIVFGAILLSVADENTWSVVMTI